MQDGSFEMRFCTDSGMPIPQIDPVADMGNFVYAVYQMSSWCGKEYMAAGTTCTWPEWIAAWSKATGKPAKFCQVPREVMIKACGDEDFGGEIADMYDYASSPGYDGGKTLLTAEDLRKVSVPCLRRSQWTDGWLTTSGRCRMPHDKFARLDDEPRLVKRPGQVGSRFVLKICRNECRSAAMAPSFMHTQSGGDCQIGKQNAYQTTERGATES